MIARSFGVCRIFKSSARAIGFRVSGIRRCRYRRAAGQVNIKFILCLTRRAGGQPNVASMIFPVMFPCRCVGILEAIAPWMVVDLSLTETSRFRRSESDKAALSDRV